MRTFSIAVGLSLSLASAVVCAQPVSPVLDFHVVDEASYQNFLGAIHKSEHVRFAYVQNPKPRVVAAVAGLLEFATQNPLADQAQLTAFVGALDTKLQTFFVDTMMMPIDPDLKRHGQFITAARFSTPLTGVPTLVGASTDIGQATMRLLNIEVPEPDRFEDYQDRMEVFELVQLRDFEDAPEWQNLLMIGFSGQDLSGAPNAALSGVLTTYLMAQGYDPTQPPPCDPSSLGAVDTGKAKGVVVSGNLAFVADNDVGLAIVDISNPAAPFVVGSINTPGSAFGVALNGQYAYMASHFGGGLDVINVSNPAAPVVTGSVGLGSSFSSVTNQGSIVYVTNDAGLMIINAGNPAIPTIVGQVTTPGLGFGVAVQGTTAYVADRDGGLHILDVSNPAGAVFLGSHSTPGDALGVAASGTLAYVASDTAGLAIFDVSDPMAPILLGVVDTPGSARSVVVSGSWAYVADSGAGLQIIDISDPMNPFIVDAVDTPDVAFGLAISGGFAYVGDEQSGLQVLDIASCQPDPVEAGLAMLPVDYASYHMLIQEIEDAAAITNPMNPSDPAALTARSQALQGSAIMSAAFNCQQNIANESYIRLQELTQVMMNEPDLNQGVITEANPALLAGIDAAYIAKRDRVAPDRASLAALAMMMNQAQDTTVHPIGEPLPTPETLSYSLNITSEKVLKNNRGFAAASEGVKIAGGIAVALMSIKPPDPVGLVTSSVDIITGALGLGSLFTSSPTPEEMILEQLQQMSMQIGMMQEQLNERFDRVEQQLNQVYIQLSAGINEINRNIGELKAEVQMNQEYILGIRYDMLNVQASLDRIEEALWGVGATLLLIQFADDFDAALAFRADTLSDFPFVLTMPNFDSSSQNLSQFATIAASGPVFAGPSGVALTPDNATQQLALDNVGNSLPTPLSIGRKVNDLAAYPGTIPGGAALGSGLAGPGAWSQGASAFAQLLRENPWYYAGRPGNLAEMTSVIAKGAALQTAARNARSQVLFDSLLLGLQNSIAAINTEVNAAIARHTDGQDANSTGPDYDPWGGIALHGQPLAGQNMGPGQSYKYPDSNPFDNCNEERIFSITNNASGWNIFGSTDLPEVAAAFYPVSPDTFGQPGKGVYLSRSGAQLTIAFELRTSGGNIRRAVTYLMKANGVDQSLGGLCATFFPFNSIAFFCWNNGIRAVMEGPPENQTIGRVIACGNWFDGTNHAMTATILSEQTTITGGLDTNVLNQLRARQDQVWLDLANPATNTIMLSQQKKVSGYVDLIDAYLTFGMPDLLEKSGVVRAALRGDPEIGELSVRLPLPLQSLMASFIGTGDEIAPGVEVNLWTNYFGARLGEGRINLQNEINLGLSTLKSAGHAYIAWNLADLRHLQANRGKLAVDDTYLATSGESLDVPAVSGLLRNDVKQQFRPICVDTSTAPTMTAQGGAVMISSDGSFMYAPPNASFTGTDTFTYRLASDLAFRPPPMLIPECPQAPFTYSLPATVVIRVVPPAFCPGDANGSGFIDFDDITSVIANWGADYGAGTGPGDANNDSLVDFDDITTVIANWGATCP